MSFGSPLRTSRRGHLGFGFVMLVLVVVCGGGVFLWDFHERSAMSSYGLSQLWNGHEKEERWSSAVFHGDPESVEHAFDEGMTSETLLPYNSAVVSILDPLILARGDVAGVLDAYLDYGVSARRPIRGSGGSDSMLGAALRSGNETTVRRVLTAGGSACSGDDVRWILGEAEPPDGISSSLFEELKQDASKC